MAKLCSVLGCDSTTRCKGLCSLHYSRKLRTGSTGPVEPVTMPRSGECGAQDCTSPIRSRGLCESHYSMFLRKGHTERWVSPNQYCKIPECGRPHSQRGLCKLHEARERRTGTTDDPPPRTRSICTIDGCGRWVSSNGLCMMHHRRLKSNGSPLVVSHGGRKARAIQDRFHEYLTPAGAQECWPWGGTVNTYGYGVISYSDRGKRRQRVATRVSYEVFKGDIPDGAIICHTCDNPICVNPGHLYAGTYQDNADDRWSPLPTPRPNPEDAAN